MTLVIDTEPVPLDGDADDVLRVRGTRVTLQTIVSAFLEGATPEQIAYQYPSVPLADIYSVVAYYLRHRPAVDAYLASQRERAERVRQENESRFDPAGIRERLLARRDRTVAQ